MPVVSLDAATVRSAVCPEGKNRITVIIAPRNVAVSCRVTVYTKILTRSRKKDRAFGKFVHSVMKDKGKRNER